MSNFMETLEHEMHSDNFFYIIRRFIQPASENEKELIIKQTMAYLQENPEIRKRINYLERLQYFQRRDSLELVRMFFFYLNESISSINAQRIYEIQSVQSDNNNNNSENDLDNGSDYEESDIFEISSDSDNSSDIILETSDDDLRNDIISENSDEIELDDESESTSLLNLTLDNVQLEDEYQFEIEEEELTTIEQIWSRVVSAALEYQKSKSAEAA